LRIVYLILAHRYPAQLNRLVRRLDAGNSHFLIHVDKKVGNGEFSSMARLLAHRQNVRFVKRYTCHWGGYGIVQATLQGLKEIKEHGIEFDYVCLLSGQDYPIKSNDSITRFFEAHRGKSFIRFDRFPKLHWAEENGGYDRYENWYLLDTNKRYGFPNKIVHKVPYLNAFVTNTLGRLVPKRKFPSGFHPYGGAQFWALHRDHAAYLTRTIANDPSFYEFFKYVRIPDEILFQTLMGNYEHADSEIVNRTLHFMEWSQAGAVLSLTTANMDSIAETDHLFARKFDATIDAQVLDLIDQRIDED